MSNPLNVRRELQAAKQTAAGGSPERLWFYSALSIVCFLLAVGLACLMIWKAETLTAFGLTGKLFYLVLIPMALAAALFLFGVLRSVAIYRGQSFGGTIEMSGPIIAAVLVVWGGFAVPPRRGRACSMTVFIHGPDGRQDVVLRGHGRVVMDLSGNRRFESIDEKGAAHFPGIPIEFRAQLVSVRCETAMIMANSCFAGMIHKMTLWDLLDSGSHHLKMAARAVRQHRKTSLAAAGILSIGIGMSVAMFSLVDAVLLRPLPFPRQQSVEVIWKIDPAAGRYVEELAYPELRDLQQNIRDFEYVAVMPTSLYGYARVLRVGKADPVQIESAPVSHDFFRVLGVSPMLGRDFNDSDEHVGAPPVVIVSHRVWRTYLESDEHIAGRMIRLNGQGHTVIGVMAPGVEFPRGAGFWVPLGIESRVVERRGATFLQAIARVKPGVSHQHVVNEVDGLVQRLALQFPEAYSRSQRASVTPLTEYWTGSSRVHLWILLGASVLLLAASVLSAGILMVSGVLGRGTELATRIALGAGSRQILQQLGAEGALIALIAGALGTGLAGLLIRLLVGLAPTDIPRLSEAGLNPASVAFALTTAVFAAMVCTIMPGMSALRVPLEAALREGGTRLSLSRQSLRTRNTFVLAQAAVTVVMLALSGLFLVSYGSMMSADIGFHNRDALTVNLQLRGAGLFATQGLHRHAFYARLLDRLRESPGVTSAAAVLVRPLEGPIGWERGYRFEFDAGQKDAARLPKANYEAVTPGYFRTVGTPLLEGRDFTEHDSEASESVAIISRSLAERIRAAGHSPLGHRIQLANSPDWIKVVGVCADARYRNVTQEDATIFQPYLQAPAPTHYVVIRGTRSAHQLGLLVRRALAEIDPEQAVAGDATIGELIEANVARHRFNMILLLWFAGCATVLAGMGIYGVVAETIVARKQEIAIRIALGAPRGGVVHGMVSKTLRFALLGEALGLCAVILLYPRISEVLYGVAKYRPALLGVVAVLVFAVSFCAGFWPAWSAVDQDSIDVRLR